LEELRRLRDDALSHRSNDPLVDAYRRGAMEMALLEIGATQVAPMPPLMDTFRVEVLGVARVPSGFAGAIAAGVQMATLQMDLALRKPEAAALRRQLPADPGTVVIQEGAVGNTLIFRAPAMVVEDEDLQMGPYPSRASHALRELMNVLPENSQDVGSFVRRIDRAPKLERQAIHTMMALTLNSPNGLGFNLQSPETTFQAVVNREGAQEIDTYLLDRSVVTIRETVIGLLDGFRGTRRVFYLIREDGREIAGSVDDRLLPTVQQLAGRRVRAELVATRWTSRSGKLGPKHYDLVKLEPDLDVGTLFEQ
jgi:hypothetical protein